MGHASHRSRHRYHHDAWGHRGQWEKAWFSEVPRGPADVEAVATTEIATAKLIIEYNSTDDDIGVHGAFDDHGWKTLCVFDPTGRPVLEVAPRANCVI